jgi:hypothetical protein
MAVASRRVVDVLAVVVLVAVLVLALARWWSSPSPESEAAAYFGERAPGVVSDLECVYAEDPEGSFFWGYLCSFTAGEAIPPTRRDPGVPQGRSTYCFTIPRSASPLHRADLDAGIDFPATRAAECTH